MIYWCMCLIILNTIVFQSSANKNITIINYETKNDRMGNSNFNYTLSDGSTREESVRVVNKDTENEYPEIKGIYSIVYNLSENAGVRYIVRYVADTNGFRSQVEKHDLDYDPTPIFYPEAGIALITTLQGGGIG